MHRVRSRSALVALAFSAILLTACSSKKQAAVTIDNQSSAPLQIEVTMPSRGVFGRKPCLEGFVTRLEPGESWESTPDSRRWSMDPNPKRSFRLVAVEHTQQPWLIYEPAWFDTGKTTAHFVLRGHPGEITCAASKSPGSDAGQDQTLTPRKRE
ncbi:MAG: hypothetical protein IT438_04120 [Phycisphaerales bacterium]|nr:hypothetical protein [Phycisphaerales bacterium]